MIQFGTGGWRGIIAEDFTFDNVRRLAHAIALQVIEAGMQGQPVVIGYDRRFQSDRFAEAAAEVMAGHGLKVMLTARPVPTPVVTFTVVNKQAACGLTVTASHNPPSYNGIKLDWTHGEPVMPEMTSVLEDVANQASLSEIPRMALEEAKKSGQIELIYPNNDYIDAVIAKIDKQAVRNAHLSVAFDPMYGAGLTTLGTILIEARCRLRVIHDRHDALFGGRSPEPTEESLFRLIALVRSGGFDLGLATDGDADRLAVVDEKGQYLHPNEVLMLLYYHLVKHRGEVGGVVRNVMTTHMLDRMARRFGERVYETPVGFRWISDAMRKHNAVLGGESSGGSTIRGHILGKDGILAGALVTELLAKEQRPLGAIMADLYEQVGRLYFYQRNVPLSPEVKTAAEDFLAQRALTEIGGRRVEKVVTIDGYKYLFSDDEWVAVRFSGTEPLLRIAAESAHPAGAKELVDDLCDQMIAGGA